MSETFVYEKPEDMTYASWESLVDALLLYIDEWEDYDDDGEE